MRTAAMMQRVWELSRCQCRRVTRILRVVPLGVAHEAAYGCTSMSSCMVQLYLVRP